jgi:hypothetical protein
MKKIIGLFALVSLLASSAQASLFNYSFTGDNGSVVTGSFNGTANGNLITGLSDITASLNGNAYNGSGNLFGSSWGSSNWVSGGAVASFNGLQNNFLFIDADYPNNYNWSNYFYSVSGVHESFAYQSSSNYNYNYTQGNTSTANWHVTATNVPEPSSVILFGLGLMALVRFRRKHA